MPLKACVPSTTWKNQAAPPTQPGTSPFYCKRGIKQLFVPLPLEMHRRQTRGGGNGHCLKVVLEAEDEKTYITRLCLFRFINVMHLFFFELKSCACFSSQACLRHLVNLNQN